MGLNTHTLPTNFERWRSSLEKISGMELLNALTQPQNAEVCIQFLPVEDLHRYLFSIGLEDSEMILALASKEQVQGILDMELWDRAELNLTRVDIWQHALLRSGPEVLYEHMLALDDEMLAWVLKANTYTEVIDDPETFTGSDIDHILTPDRRLCIYFPRAEDVDLPTKVFVNQLMQDNPTLCIRFLLGSTAALRSHLEEEAYRWRTVRMSERGFIDFYDAIQVYCAPPSDWKRAFPPSRIFEDQPPAKLWLARVIATEQRLDEAFAALSWEHALTLAELLGYVANMMLSADRVQLWDEEAKEQTLRRLRAGLTLALELLNGPEADSQRDAEILSKHHLNYLFRLGYERMVSVARPVWRVYQLQQKSQRQVLL